MNGKELTDQIADSTNDGENKVPESQKKLHNGLVEKGLYSKGFDEFRVQFKDSTSMARLHEGLRKQNLYSKDFESFKSQFFPNIEWGEDEEGGKKINEVLKSASRNLEATGSEVDLKEIAKASQKKREKQDSEGDTIESADMGVSLDDAVSTFNEETRSGYESSDRDALQSPESPDIDASEVDMEALERNQEVANTANSLFNKAFNAYSEQAKGEELDSVAPMTGEEAKVVADALIADLQEASGSNKWNSQQKDRARRLVGELQSKRREIEEATLEDYYENTTLSQRAINAVKQGFYGMSMGFSARTILDSEKLRVYEAVENGAYDSEYSTIPTVRSGVVEENETKAIARRYKQASPEEREVMRNKAQENLDEAHKSLVQYGLKMQEIPSSPSAKKFMQAKNTDDMWQAFTDDPMGVAMEVSLQSAPALIPLLFAGTAGTVVGSATGNPALGIGVASGMGGMLSQQMEYGNKIIEALESEGVDIQDKDALDKAVQNEELMERVKDKSLTSSSIVGLFDGLSMLIPGAYMTKMASKKLQGSVAKHIGKEVLEKTGMIALQGALGGGGEAGSQLNTFGEIKNVGAVGAEVLGELTVSGPAEIYAMTQINNRIQERKLQAIVADMGVSESVLQGLGQARQQAVEQGNPVTIREIDMLTEEIQSKRAKAVSSVDMDKLQEYRTTLIERVRKLEKKKGARVQLDQGWEALTNQIANIDNAIEVYNEANPEEADAGTMDRFTESDSEGTVFRGEAGYRKNRSEDGGLTYYTNSRDYASVFEGEGGKAQNTAMEEAESIRSEVEILEESEPEMITEEDLKEVSDAWIKDLNEDYGLGISGLDELYSLYESGDYKSLPSEAVGDIIDAYGDIKDTENKIGDESLSERKARWESELAEAQDRLSKKEEEADNYLNPTPLEGNSFNLGINFAEDDSDAIFAKLKELGIATNKKEGEFLDPYQEELAKYAKENNIDYYKGITGGFKTSGGINAPAQEYIVVDREGDRSSSANQGDGARSKSTPPISVESVYDEYGEMRGDIVDQAYELAKQREVNILSDKEPNSVVTDEDGNVIGATFVSFNQDGDGGGKYGFDIVVAEEAEGKGVGSALVDDVKELPMDIEDAYPNATVEVDVVNPRMREILERKGFKVDAEIAGDRVLMVPDPDFTETTGQPQGETSLPERMANAKNNVEVFEEVSSTEGTQRTAENGKPIMAVDGTPIVVTGHLKNGKAVNGVVMEYRSEGVGNRKKPLVKVFNYVDTNGGDRDGTAVWVEPEDLTHINIGEQSIVQEEVMEQHGKPVSESYETSDVKTGTDSFAKEETVRAKDDSRPNPVGKITKATTEEEATQIYDEKKAAITKELWKEVDLDRLTHDQLTSYVYSKMLDAGMVANSGVIPKEYRGNAVKYSANRMSTNELLDYFDKTFDGLNLKSDAFPTTQEKLNEFIEKALSGLDLGTLPQSEVNFANEALSSLVDRAKRRVESEGANKGDIVYFNQGRSQNSGKVVQKDGSKLIIKTDSGATITRNEDKVAPLVPDDYEGVISDEVIGKAPDRTEKRVKPKLPQAYRDIIDASKQIVELQDKANDVRQSTAQNKMAIKNDPTLSDRQKAEEIKAQLKNRTKKLARITVQIEQAERKIAKAEEESGKSIFSKIVDEFGSENRVVTREEARKASEVLIKEMGQLNAGISPKAIKESIKLGTYLIESGVRSFKQFADIMVRDMGPVILPKLKEIYQKSASKAKLEEGIATDQEIETYLQELTASSADYGLVNQANNDMDVPTLAEAEQLILARSDRDQSVRDDLEGADVDMDEVNTRVRRNRIYDAYRIANTIRAREKTASSFPEFYNQVREIAGNQKHFTRQELKEGWVRSLNMEQKGSSTVMEDYLHNLWGGTPYRYIQNFLEVKTKIRKKLQDTDINVLEEQREIMQDRGAMYFEDNEDLDVYLARSLEVGRRSAMHEQIIGFENPNSDINQIMRRMQELGLNHGDWKKYANLMKTAQKIEGRRGGDSAQFRQQAHDAIANDDLQRFLHAKHATERNAYLANRTEEEIDAIKEDIAEAKKIEDEDERARVLEKLNKNLEDAQDRLVKASRGSGLTNEEAGIILDEFEKAGKTEALEEVSGMVYDLNNKLLDLYEQSGLLDEEFLQDLRERYENYVPLNRNMADHFGDYADGFVSNSGGFGKLGEIKKAYGSDRPVDHIMSNIIINWERVISDASKNRERNTLADLVDSEWEQGNKNLGYTLAEDSEQAKRLEQDQPQTMTIPYKKDGENRLIVMPQEAKGIYDAFEGNDVIKFNSNALSMALRSFMNYLRFVRTSGSLNFLISNPQRDIGTAFFNMASDFGYGGSGQFLQEYVHGQGKFFSSHRAVWDYVKGKDTDLAKMYQELKDLGGTTGFYKLSDKDDIMSKITDINKRFSKNRKYTNPAEWGRSLLKGIDDMNEVMENATRLSAYNVARDRGHSQKRAALYALEITTNFNRQGDWGQIGKVVYQFANSAIQGHTRMLRAGKRDPKTFMKTTMSIMTAGILESAWNDGMNPEEYDRLRRTQGWMFDSNMVFTNPEGEVAFKLYLPFGYNVFKTLGNLAYDVSIGRITAEEASGVAGTSFANAFNPFRGSTMFESPEGFVNAVTPSFLEPVTEVAMNKGFFGSIYPVYQEEFQEQLDLEDWQVSYEDPNIIADKIAKWTALNKDWLDTVTLGDDPTLSPHTIEHIAQFLGGSVGREWLNAIGKDHITTETDEEGEAGDILSRRGVKLWKNADGTTARLDPNYVIIASRFMRTFKKERVSMSNMYKKMGEYVGKEGFKVYGDDNRTTEAFDELVRGLAKDYEDYSSSDGFIDEDREHIGGRINDFVRVVYRRQIEEQVINEIRSENLVGPAFEEERKRIYRRYNERPYRIPKFHPKYGFSNTGTLVPTPVKNWKPMKEASIERVELLVNNP